MDPLPPAIDFNSSLETTPALELDSSTTDHDRYAGNGGTHEQRVETSVSPAKQFASNCI